MLGAVGAGTSLFSRLRPMRAAMAAMELACGPDIIVGGEAPSSRAESSPEGEAGVFLACDSVPLLPDAPLEGPGERREQCWIFLFKKRTHPA